MATAALALAVTAACGGDGGGAGVASLSGSTSTAEKRPGGGDSAGTGPSAEFEDAMVDFARCMREHGVDFPDPEPGSRGGIRIGPGRVDPGDPDLEDARAACQSILNEARNSMPKRSEEELAEMRDNMLAFAKCMREQGIDFPDPRVDDSGRVQIRGGGPRDDPEFAAAQEKCSKETGGFRMGGPGRAGSR